MKDILKFIQEAGAAEVDAIFEASFDRKRELYPQWDLFYFAMPREEGEERRRTIAWVQKDLQDMQKE